VKIDGQVSKHRCTWYYDSTGLPAKRLSLRLTITPGSPQACL